VSSRSGEASCELLYSVYLYLLPLLITHPITTARQYTNEASYTAANVIHSVDILV